MADYIKKVEEFHRTFGAPVLESPQIPPKERCELRITLLQEELDELKEAIANNDIAEAADALGDLQVILSGSILEFGMGDKFDQVFDDIHQSNMSKACTSQQEAIETLMHYKEKDGTEGYYVEKDGKWIVYRKGDDKVLKSIGYIPANPGTIIKG
jgi:predicted HAD superfamily Cof-like phosphohydrolase